MTTDTAALPKCPLWRRLAAALYDALLLFGVLGVATFVALPVTGNLGDGHYHPLFTVYLFMVSFFFFGWFWTHGGQTLGMKVWGIRVQNRDGGPITLWQAALRFIVAIFSWLMFGLGFLWSLLDKEKLTWHDRYSMTVLVVLPKKK
ncbi:MAG TPA: RDD family protein [Gammaproteobacteria bacterium]